MHKMQDSCHGVQTTSISAKSGSPTSCWPTWPATAGHHRGCRHSHNDAVTAPFIRLHTGNLARWGSQQDAHWARAMPSADTRYQSDIHDEMLRHYQQGATETALQAATGL